MQPDTICIHGRKTKTDSSGALGVPIYQSATFAHPGVAQSTGYDYSRVQNPTRENLEEVVNHLEGGLDSLAFASGMAAIAALMELFKHGDHVLASDDLYGGSIRLFEHISQKNGVMVEYVNTNDIPALLARLRPETRGIFIETPTNPMMRVTDIAAVKKAVQDKNILVIVDNTLLTPYFQQPLKLGADIVMHSGTKYLGGHNDTLAGFLTVNNAELSEKLRFIYKTTGACLAPIDSFMMIRGIKTLALRMEKSQSNAFALANWLKTHPKVRKVFYPGLPEHPDYDISRKQARGFGAMMSFEVDSEATAHEVLEKINLIFFAESFGGVETLMTYPMLQTHANIAAEIREARGINDRLLRLSVGIENPDDLIADLAQALG